MGLTWTALGMKWLSVWVVLLLIGLISGPTPGQGAVMAAVLALVSWWADRMLDFRVQGVTRWAIDSGLAGLGIYLAQFLWPGQYLPFYLALLAGFMVGALEIPLHFYLASRFGLAEREDDRKDRVR